MGGFIIGVALAIFVLLIIHLGKSIASKRKNNNTNVVEVSSIDDKNKEKEEN